MQIYRHQLQFLQRHSRLLEVTALHINHFPLAKIICKIHCIYITHIFLRGLSQKLCTKLRRNWSCRMKHFETSTRYELIYTYLNTNFHSKVMLPNYLKTNKNLTKHEFLIPSFNIQHMSHIHSNSFFWVLEYSRYQCPSNCLSSRNLTVTLSHPHELEIKVQFNISTTD